MAAGREPEHHRGPPPAPASASRKAPKGQPWSHEETFSLIEAYEEKWYALKRGQLRAQQWEEVADAVAARCGLVEPSKTGTQCRHKIEKLRKRYRAERLRIIPSPWPYFDRMDRMERGPLPISVRLPPAPPPSSVHRGGVGGSGGSDDDEDVDDEDEEEDDNETAGNNTRSIKGILREGNWGFSRVPRNPKPQNPMSNKKRAFEVEEDEDEEDGDYNENVDDEGRGGSLSELAAVVRRFGDGMVRMEKRRMEMMREVERDWMEMEAKRAEMVIEAERCLVEMIAGASSSLKKAKKSQDM